MTCEETLLEEMEREASDLAYFAANCDFMAADRTLTWAERRSLRTRADRYRDMQIALLETWTTATWQRVCQTTKEREKK